MRAELLLKDFGSIKFSPNPCILLRRIVRIRSISVLKLDIPRPMILSYSINSFDLQQQNTLNIKYCQSINLGTPISISPLGLFPSLSVSEPSGKASLMFVISSYEF